MIFAVLMLMTPIEKALLERPAIERWVTSMQVQQQTKTNLRVGHGQR